MPREMERPGILGSVRGELGRNKVGEPGPRECKGFRVDKKKGLTGVWSQKIKSPFPVRAGGSKTG